MGSYNQSSLSQKEQHLLIRSVSNSTTYINNLMRLDSEYHNLCCSTSYQEKHNNLQ